MVKETNVGKYRVSFRTLNSKDRKGEYVYIVDTQTKKRRYYKRQEGTSVQDYLTAFEGGIKVKSKGVRSYKDPESFKSLTKSISKRPSIDQIISKGITNTEIPDLRKVSATNERIYYAKMLKPLVKDEQLLNILSENHNVNKFKHRLSYYIELVGEVSGQEESFILKSTGTKTLNEIKNDFSKRMFNNAFSAGTLSFLQKNGYKIVSKGDDIRTYDLDILRNVKRMYVRMTFTKGK